MKAILILNEMPKRCGNCPLLQQWYDDEYKKRFDMCFWRYCKIEDTEGKLNVCPLKPLPNEISHFEIEDEYEYWRIEGYNQCLREILGGEKE